MQIAHFQGPGGVHHPLAQDDDEEPYRKEDSGVHESRGRSKFEPYIVGERYAHEHEYQGKESREGDGGYQLIFLPEIIRYLESV